MNTQLHEQVGNEVAINVIHLFRELLVQDARHVGLLVLRLLRRLLLDIIRLVNESSEVNGTILRLLHVDPVAEHAESADACHLECEFVLFAFVLAIVNAQDAIFVRLVCRVHGELLELDAEREFLLEALTFSLRHVVRALHFHCVHEAEVDAANADLQVVENTRHELLLEAARGLAVRRLEQGLLLEELLKLLQQVLRECAISMQLLLFEPFALGLELNESKHIADFDHKWRLEHVPDGDLQMDATDKALLELER